MEMFTVIQMQAAQIVLSMTLLIAVTIYQLTDNTFREFTQYSVFSQKIYSNTLVSPPKHSTHCT
jgi:hypothetical protein